MDSNQLILFKGVEVKRLDSVLAELHNLIYALKHFAMVIETSDSRNRAFNLTLDTTREVASLCAGLSDLSFKYIDWSRDNWKKVCHYEPYYAALEPRSPFRLYEIASDYKSRSKAILLRLEGCLKRGSITIPKEVKTIEENLIKITKLLRREGFEL